MSITTASQDLRQRLIQHRSQIAAIAQQHGATHLRLFGSVALGTATANSDIDLLAEIDPRRSLLDRIALKHALEDLLACHVDIARPNQLHPAIRAAALAIAIPLEQLSVNLELES
jgi:predicted nucleotidyltransferase